MRDDIENTYEFKSLGERSELDQMLGELADGSSDPNEQLENLEFGPNTPEGRAKLQEAQQNLLENISQKEKITSILQDLAIFQKLVKKIEDTDNLTLDLLIQGLGEGQFDEIMISDQVSSEADDDYSLDDLEIRGPAFNTADFIDNIENSINKRILKQDNTIAETIEILTKKKLELEESVRLGRNWHRRYQEEIKRGATKINKELGI